MLPPSQSGNWEKHICHFSLIPSLKHIEHSDMSVLNAHETKFDFSSVQYTEKCNNVPDHCNRI